MTKEHAEGAGSMLQKLKQYQFLFSELVKRDVINGWIVVCNRGRMVENVYHYHKGDI